MSLKKIKLEVKALPNGGLYEVSRVSNSIEWTPGETLNKEDLEKITFRPGVEVVVSKR